MFQNLSKVGLSNSAIGAYVTRYMLVKDAQVEQNDQFKYLMKALGEIEYPIPEYDDPYYPDED